MKTKEALIIALTIFLTVIGWIVADIFHILNTEKIKVISPTVIKPINVHIDPTVFVNIESKQ